MANLLILAPATIAAIAASRGADVANLLTPDPREVWADSVVGTAATIDIDLGVVRAIDTVALCHVTPPHANATWTITGGAAGYTTTTIKAASALRVPDVAGRSPALSHALWHGPSVNVRYVRISVTQPVASATLTAGVALIGQAFSPSKGQEWGAGRRVIDTGTSTGLPDGGFATVEGVRKSSWSWTLGDLTDDERDQLYELALSVGETRPVLVVEDPAATAGLRRRMHYGLLRQLRPYERANHNRTKWEMTVEEWGGDESAPL